MSITSKKQTGFTIVELLIVIVVIGILAAITIVAYNGVQDRAHDTIVKQDMSVLAKKLEYYRIDNDRYPAANIPALLTLDYRISKSSYKSDSLSNLQYCIGADREAYAYAAESKSGKWFYMASTNNQATEYTGPLPLDDGPCNNIQAITGAPVVDIGISGYVQSATPQWRVWTGIVD